MHSLPGPGDIAIAAMARDELASRRWLRDADDSELIEVGICPECRDPDNGGPASHCRHCDGGHVLRCQHCGAAIRPGAIVLVDGEVADQAGRRP